MAPRHAHRLVVLALATGMALGPATSARAQAPASAPKVVEPEAEASAEPKPKRTEGEPKRTEGEPKRTEGESTEGEPTAREGEPTATEGEPTEEGEATATEGEPKVEPAVEVRPTPVRSAPETRKALGGDSSREVVADPRRLRADERMLFRAGLLSLGVAAVAVVPTVIGLQQASVARREGLDQRARTMNQLGIGAGIAAGAYAITGVVLLSLGSRHRAERRTALAPALGPGQVGAMLRARF